MRYPDVNLSPEQWQALRTAASGIRGRKSKFEEDLPGMTNVFLRLWLMWSEWVFQPAEPECGRGREHLQHGIYYHPEKHKNIEEEYNVKLFGKPVPLRKKHSIVDLYALFIIRDKHGWLQPACEDFAVSEDGDLMDAELRKQWRRFWYQFHLPKSWW